MQNIKLEYIWLDGSNPQQIRSKTKIVNLESLEGEANIFESLYQVTFSIKESSLIESVESL